MRGSSPAGPASTPQLPDETARTDAGDVPQPSGTTLRAGCYLLRLTRSSPGPEALSVRYDGTLRVELRNGSALSSGDLYLHGPIGAPAALLPPEADPGAGIPIFPRSRYRYYVRVTELLDGSSAGEVTLGFELHRFDHASNTWSNEGGFSARLHREPAPPGYPSPDDFLAGDLRDGSDAHAGLLTMGLVSPHLRRAVIEVDRVADSERPLANAAGLDWPAIFEQVGWQLELVDSDADLTEPSGESWSPAEMHAAMLDRRDSADLDSEWRYWLICVRSLDGDEARGLMFDRDGADSNNIPREAAGIASHWTIPDEEAWGLARGMRFGSATDPYFRTAVHEIGHAMGLYHNTADNGFMSTTDVISRSAVAPQRFPENILWSHARRDQKRLRHLPDIWIRPGGVPFGASYGTAPIVSADAMVEPEGLRLDVEPLLAAVPIGAPVRVSITLRNEDRGAVAAPDELSLKTGYVSGSVTDPAGSVRSFRPLVRRTDRHVADLAPGESRTGSMTLLRGSEGHLFPMAGPYTVEVHLDWELDDVPVRVVGETDLMVLPAVDRAHAEAALWIMQTPDAVVTLALGGDHLEEGIAAIHAALGNDVLRPHYAYIEAKRLATGFQQRPPDLAGAADLIESDTVMTGAEVAKAAKLVQGAADRGETPPSGLVAVLREKAESLPAPD
jgi:hypothetical protein